MAAGLFGVVRIASLEPENSVRLLLVQQNINSWEPGGFPDALSEAQRLTLAELIRERRTTHLQVDAVVWSETALRRPYSFGEEYYARFPEKLSFREFLSILDVPLVTGAPVNAAPNSGELSNGAVVLASDGTLLDAYAKQQLVPFAERVPMWYVPAVRRFFREILGLPGSWVLGTESGPVALPVRGRPLLIGTPISFEDSFGWVSRAMVLEGAELLVNLTNNSWSRRDSAQIQHFVAARLRAIELRTTVVRSTNSGLTTVVDARGVASNSLPMFQAAARTVDVPLYGDRRTLYRAYGDWFGIGSLALTALFAATALKRDTGGPA